MARLNISSEQVRQLIGAKVLPLLLVFGNVAALAKRLNDALQASGQAGRIHANRLHALLSDDPGRSLNEASVTLIELAADAVLATEDSIAARAAEVLKSLVDEARTLYTFSTLSVVEIAERMSIPPALAAKLLDPQQVPAAPARNLVSQGVPTAGFAAEPPDWTYQDIAVARSLDAFNRRPSGGIGLILPTGAGKTRTALRIVLRMLAASANSQAPAYWVTHRRNLREQAYRELQKLIAAQDDPGAGADLTELANRIKFVMVGDLGSVLTDTATRPVLIVVDEAHHAAAPSYQPVFDNQWGAPVLLLTATPNRGDRLPIGIDEIAFTITYRELAERRAVLTPTFLDFPVQNFDWSADALADLADYVIDWTTTEFTKVLVLAPRIDRVQEFYDALVDKLPGNHPLDAEDIGFVHGEGNSLGIDNEDFLARFANKPRAVLVSAQLLLEGFDDPGINAVVLTYPSTSVIRLMQAAGRCVRFAPDKRAAYVVQAKNESLAYHFDQRWLYQEIDDFLRPELRDLDYESKEDLLAKARTVLASHRVDARQANRALARLESLLPGETCRLFLYGLPYYEALDRFHDDARWGSILETSENSHQIRSIFNEFCELGADLSDPSDFLHKHGTSHGLGKDLTPGSRWMEMTGLLTASYFAKREVHGPSAIDAAGHRPYKQHGATTWLKYVSLTYRPAVPTALADFLRDCHNAVEIEAQYLQSPSAFHSIAKVPLPLSGSEAFLLDSGSSRELLELLEDLRQRLAQASPREQFGVLAAALASESRQCFPIRLHHRIEFLLDPSARASRILVLNSNSVSDPLQERPNV